jgi:putative transposase
MREPIRKARCAWNEPGHAHFVTYSCFRRQPLLTRERTRRWVVETIQTVRLKQDVAVWGYVIMPEHVHLLVHPRRSTYSMSAILAGLKRPVSEAAKAHLTATGQTAWLEKLTVRYPGRTVFRFWEPGGGYDRNVQRDRSIPAILDYIHANPVRRELVETPTDWEWSSARFWDGRRDVPLRMDDPFEGGSGA